MSVLSLELKSSSRTIRNDMLLKNLKMQILLIIAVIFLIYIILVLGCGGFALSRCFWYLSTCYF